MVVVFKIRGDFLVFFMEFGECVIFRCLEVYGGLNDEKVFEF